MRTFGCQMNEHDSERIAGLLEADGLGGGRRPRRRRRRRPQHLLHPRERRQQALRQPRPPQDVEGRARRPPDRRVRLPGPEGPRHRAPPGRSRRRRDGHAQRAPRRRAVARGPARAARSPRSSTPRSSTTTPCSPRALPAVRETSYNAWVTIQIGCDNSCAFCIVPAVRGVEISRPFDDDRRRGQRARRRRRHRGHAARAERQQLRARPAAGRPPGRRRRRPGAPAVRRPAAGGRRRRRASAGSASRRPHPKDMRPETFAAMAETPAVCPQLHYPLQSGSDRVLAAMHRGYTAERYLERLAEARRVVPDLAVSTDIIVGFPGETDDDFARHARGRRRGPLRRRLHVHLLAPARHRGGRAMVDRFVEPAVAGERFDRLRVVIERSALAANQARVGRIEEVLVDGPEQEGPDGARRPARRSTGSSTSARRAPLRAGTYATVEITGAAPHHLTGELRRACSPSRRTARASPSPRSDVTAPPVVVLGPTASGKSRRGDGRGAARSPGTEIVAVDAMQVYRGMDIGTAKPHAADRAAVRHHCSTSSTPTDDFTVTELPSRRTTRRWRRSPGPRRCWSPAPACTSPPSLDRLDVPGQWPEVRRRARRRARRRRRCTAGWRRSIPSPPARIEPGNRRRIVRALEVTIGSGRPFSSYGPGLAGLPADRRRADRAALAAAGARRRASQQRVAAMIDAGLLDEVERLARRRALADRRPGARLQGAASTTSTGERTLDEAVAAIVAAHPPVRRPPGAVVPSRPPRTLDRRRTRPGGRGWCRSVIAALQA